MEIYCGDCIEIMKTLENNSIDMVLCDLPYGTTKCSWDVIVPFESLWEQYHRVVNPTGAILLFGMEPFSSLLRLSNLKEYRYDYYWKKERPTNIFQLKKRAGKVIETISVFYKEQPTYNPQMTKHEGKKRTNKIKNGHLGFLVDSGKKKPKEYIDTGFRYPTQLLEYKRDILTSNLHPTQKPLALLENLIMTFTDVGDVVLDNCMGSGSTGVACLNTNRNFIGIEKDIDYFSLAEERIKNAKL